MSVGEFHSAVGTWFRRTFDRPTEAQRRGWPEIAAGRDTLVAAPTGSGKTLAAFLSALDDLVERGLKGELDAGIRVVYVSPLKALSYDVERNLQEPLEGINRVLEEQGEGKVPIETFVRTGDTSQSQRRSMVEEPPHILATTPESLYLLLTSRRGREALETATTLIVDEIHAVADNRRGSHLALTMERLAELTDDSLQRIGLSATQNPLEAVAGFLTGSQSDGDARDCATVDAGHHRKLDLRIETTGSPLKPVMPNEQMEEVYDRVAELIDAHHTTLVFTNTRREAGRSPISGSTERRMPQRKKQKLTPSAAAGRRERALRTRTVLR